MKIAVAGGTGAVGRHVVDVARESGHDVVVLTRSNGVDLVSGSGLADALTGVDAVIDVASKQTMSAKESTQFFTTVTRNLLAAEKAAGVAHHVALSIVGSDQAPYAYYAGKVAQEKAIGVGDIPWTVLRATQFHEFAGQIYGQVKLGPFVVVPKMRSQPIAAREVAERLVDIAEGTPAGLVPDLGGPCEEQMVDMVRDYAATLPGKHWVLELPVPGAYGQAMRDGTLVPGPGADHGTQTFRDWLA
ncbi:SDR family oxidoreductase [Rhodococcus sp. P1Y]|uniref:SDR family oxidoreductase n=1 Tax=Rhodococcus sp. P1Y TaxID=1302308 RepID=UPI001F374CFC|nr:SDR family oxidoreductase [Rhodococcus sp. P1Y]